MKSLLWFQLFTTLINNWIKTLIRCMYVCMRVYNQMAALRSININNLKISIFLIQVFDVVRCNLLNMLYIC